MFEDASASIPLRQIDRVFGGAGLRLGKDPGGAGGDRRTQFRRYVAGVDQDDPQQLGRLGEALGALIDEVAASKVDFLVQAAERDGFAFADGAFRPAETAPSSFAVMTAVGGSISWQTRAPPRPSVGQRSWSNQSVGPSCASSVSRLLGKPLTSSISRQRRSRRSSYASWFLSFLVSVNCENGKLFHPVMLDSRSARPSRSPPSLRKHTWSEPRRKSVDGPQARSYRSRFITLVHAATKS